MHRTKLMIKRLCHCVFLLSLGFLTAPSLRAADSPTSRYYEDAVSRFAAGDNKGALIQLKNVLQTDPSQLPARILLAKVYMASSNYTAAEKELLMSRRMGADASQVVVLLAKVRNELKKFHVNLEELRPNDFASHAQADLWSQLGLAHFHTGDADAALIAFRNALTLLPQHPDARLGLARITLQTGDYERALEQVAAVLSENPEDPSAWYLRGAVFHAQGAYLAALESYQRTRALSPQHLQAGLGEATATLDSGDAVHAIRLLGELGKAHPEHPEIPYMLSQAYTQLGRLPDATRALQQASSILAAVAPEDLHDNPPYLLLGALVAYENNQPEVAHQYLSLYLPRRPDDVKAMKLQAATLLQLKKPLDATRVLLPLVATGGADAHVYVMLGDANIQLDDYVRAERYYADALQRAGNEPALKHKIGFAQFGQGRVDEAIATFAGQSGGGGNRNHRASVFLGILYFSRGRLSDAMLAAERVLEQQPENLIALNLKGAVTLAQGDRKQARKLFESIIERQPDFRPAHFNLAKLEAAAGSPDLAVQILNRFLAENPNDIRALQENARLYWQFGELRVAIKYFEKVREIDATAWLPIIQLVDVYIQADRAADAESTAQVLLSKIPDNVLVLHALARAQIAGNQVELAQDTLKRAFSRSGYDADLLLRTGQLQMTVAAHDDAYWSLSRAVEVRPDSIVARNALAGLLYRRGRLDEAEAQVTAVRQLESNNLFGQVLSGDIAFARRNYEQAVDIYRRSLESAKSDALSASLYRALMAAGESDEALNHLEHWVEHYPDSVRSLRLLAERYHNDGNLHAAWTTYERLARETPDDALVYNNFASLLVELDNERALRMARKAHELAPHHPAVLDTLGWALVQLGELDEGLLHLRDAVARDAASPTLRYHLAVGLQEYGKAVEARQELERALAMDQAFDDEKAARQRLQVLNKNR